MKVIDLLNKIANGEEVPKKIKLDSFTTGELVEENDYLDYEMLWEDVDGGKHTYWLFNKPTYNDKLNDEIEIIEEEPRDIEVCGSLFTRNEYNRLAGIKEDKKIKKLEEPILTEKAYDYIKLLKHKQDEIIDYINGDDKE